MSPLFIYFKKLLLFLANVSMFGSYDGGPSGLKAPNKPVSNRAKLVQLPQDPFPQNKRSNLWLPLP